MKKINFKVGEYNFFTQKKGHQEAFIDIKEGDVYFTIRTGTDDFLDVATQEEAEIISRLVRIENLLRRKK